MTVAECIVIADWTTVLRTVVKVEKLLPVVLDDRVIHLPIKKVSHT